MMNASGADSKPSIRQHTVGRSAAWHGERRRRRDDVLLVHPAEADTGIRFVIRGADRDTRTIAARWDAVVDTRDELVLGNTHGVTLRGAIPLLAALRVAGVDNAVVEVSGTRIPMDDANFEFYLDMLANVDVRAQTAPRRLLRVIETVEVRDRFGFVTLSPATVFGARVYVTTIQPGGCPGTARITLVSDFTEPHGEPNATPGRSHAKKLVQAGDTRVTRRLGEICTLPEALRATLVDMIGHLALAGAPLASYVHSHGTTPALYQALLQAVMDRGVVVLTTVDEHRARHDSVSGADVK